ncbi:PIN domain-containing protein [Streptomyces sp. NPDC088354]|uniref:PIN domain-containing protein n=1 Tax=Streptomyces sp. NPDC088354 TaxID=3365856 RepID=UPI0038229CC3
MTFDRADSVPPLLVPSGSAIHPMVLDRPMLLPVLDANALLVEACSVAKRGGQQNRISALAVTRRAAPYVAAHVLGEVDEHLPRMADFFQVPETRARQVLAQQILPSIRVVDLEIRDHLSPQTRHILHVDPEMPLKYRGDPDDAPTMALAEFLAPCVIITQDSVFSRFGFAIIEWIPVTQNLLRLAGLEATAANALFVIDLALRASGAGAHRLAVLATRYPVPALAAAAGLLWWCYRNGSLGRDTWQRRVSRAGDAGKDLLELVSAAKAEHQTLTDSLLVVESPAFPTTEQLAARHLARCGRPLTPGELRDALAVRGHAVSAAQLKRDMVVHRAFVRAPGDLWTLGRPAQGQAR